MNAYDFDDRMRMSRGVAVNDDVGALLMAQVPGAQRVRAASQREDRHGTDWWVDGDCGQPLSVDVKVRAKDCAQFGNDDLALETWSVIEPARVGWTRDPTKRTDYILWFWTDTRRWCLVPFVMLCRVFQEKWQEWGRQYGTHPQETPGTRDRGGWESECVFVPRRVVWAEIYRRFAGQPGSP